MTENSAYKSVGNEANTSPNPSELRIWNLLTRCCATQNNNTASSIAKGENGGNLPRQCRNLPLSSLSPAHCCHSLSCHSRQLAKTRALASKNRNSPHSYVQSCTCNTYISFAWGNPVSFVASLDWGAVATGLVAPGDVYGPNAKRWDDER